MKSIHPTRPAEELISTPSEIFTTLLRALQRARKSIDMEFYIFEADHIGIAIANILCRKARQGVEVRLLVDGYGSRNLPLRLRRRMTTSGVELRFMRTFWHSRNHRKMVIIDKSSAFVGSINIADRYISGNRLGVWHDAVLHLSGNIVKSLCALFEHDFNKELCEPNMELCSNKTPMLYWSECGGGGGMARLLKDVVEYAEREIIIVTPYFVPPRYALDMFRRTMERSVKVRIITSPRCNIAILDDVIRDSIGRAKALGIDVLVTHNDFIHAKMALADSRRLVIGSANLDSRSLNHNREMMLSTTNRRVCQDARRFIARLQNIATTPLEEDMRSHMPKFITRAISGLMTLFICFCYI